MSKLGPRDLKDLALPSGWDAATLELWRLQDGTTYEAVMSRMINSVSMFNSALDGHSCLPAITSTTTRQEVRYRESGGATWGLHTEYQIPDENRAEMTGHMLPRLKYDCGLGWTWDYLKDAISEDVDMDIRVFLETALDLFEVQALTRLFKREEVTGAASGLGSSGYSVPLVRGTGGVIDFTPPPYAGQTFVSTHDHFLYYSTSASAGAALEAMADHLKEHGHQSPWDVVVSLADIAVYTALTDFTPVAAEGIRYGSTQDLAVVGEEYIGVYATDYGTFRVWTSARIPTLYLAGYKTYGRNDPRNTLRRWYNPRMGDGIVPISGDKLGYPVQRVYGFAEFGYGIGPDRTNGVVTYLGSGSSYTTPTIS